MEHNYSYDAACMKLKPLTIECALKYADLRNRSDISKWFFDNRQISHESQKIWYEEYYLKSNDVMFSVYLSGKWIGATAIYRLGGGWQNMVDILSIGQYIPMNDDWGVKQQL